MTHCLVTGASGFIGARLVAQLRAQGHAVTCLVRENSRRDLLENLGVRLVVGDVCDCHSLSTAVSGVDLVYHLAGVTLAFSYGQFAGVNQRGCQQVAQACAGRTPPVPLVVLSSLAAGGPSQPGRPRVETDTDEPVSHYGRSKLAGEQAASLFAPGLPLMLLRPPVVFGPGDRAGLTLFRMIGRTGWHLVPGRTDLPLSLVYVDDLATALLRIADGEFRPGLYYVAAPTPSSYGELGQYVAAALERPLHLLRVRKGWLYLPAIWGELTGRLHGRPAVTNLDKLREAWAPGWVCSPQKFADQYGWVTPTSFADQFCTTADWYRGAGWL